MVLEWKSEGSLSLEFAPFPKFLARQPASDEHVSIGGAAQFWETRASGLQPFLKLIKLSFSSIPLPPSSSNHLSRGNVPLTDLYQQTHPSTGLQFAFVLFNQPSAEPG